MTLKKSTRFLLGSVRRNRRKTIRALVRHGTPLASARKGIANKVRSDRKIYGSSHRKLIFNGRLG